MPADRATEVPTNTGIEVTFDQDGVVDAASHWSISPKVAGRFEQHGRTLAFVPAKRLAKATIYTVTVSKGVAVKGTTDVLESDVRFRFETAGGAAGNSRIVYRLHQRPVRLRDGRSSGPGRLGGSTLLRLRRTLSEAPEERADRGRSAAGSGRRGGGLSSDPGLPGLDSRSHRAARADQGPDEGRRLRRQVSTATDDGDYLWFQLPSRLKAGWYLVTLPAPSHPIQTVLQVTDIAGYLVVSDTRTLVWANDLATKGPVAGATVASDGVDLGQTDADGTRVVATPAGLNGGRRLVRRPVLPGRDGPLGRSRHDPPRGRR